MGADRIEFDQFIVRRRFENAWWITLHGEPEGIDLDRDEAARLGRILTTWAETGELKDE